MINTELTQKERMLLTDLKGEEQLCAERYARAAAEACDPQLKNLFSDLAQNEREHLNSLTELEQGRIPQLGGGAKPLPTFCRADLSVCPNRSCDSYLCRDALAAEKHTSHSYDVCVFEFVGEPVRNVLNHIQKEEQRHGKELYDYMSVNGMYG